jgi:hypothetical protein
VLCRLARAGRFLRKLRFVQEVALAFGVEARHAPAAFVDPHRLFRARAVLGLVARIALGLRLLFAFFLPLLAALAELGPFSACVSGPLRASSFFGSSSSAAGADGRRSAEAFAPAGGVSPYCTLPF